MRVFLSYAHADSAWVPKVRAAIAAAGFDVWTDAHLTAGTSSWTTEIEKAIRGATAVVVVLTPAANASQWVANEVQYALEHGIRVIPLLAEGTVSTSIPIALIRTQHLDLRRPGTLADLTRSLQGRPTATPGSSPRPTTPPPRSTTWSPGTGGAQWPGARPDYARTVVGGPYRATPPPTMPAPPSPVPSAADRFDSLIGRAAGTWPDGHARPDTGLVVRRLKAVTVDVVVGLVVTIALLIPGYPAVIAEEGPHMGDAECVSSELLFPPDSCSRKEKAWSEYILAAFLLIYPALHAGQQLQWGRTLGKRIAGVKVVGSDGGPPSTGAVLLRAVLLPVDIYLVGAVLIAISSNRRRLGDMVGGTYVVAAEPVRVRSGGEGGK